MDRVLTKRVTHLRPPVSPPASDAGAIEVRLSDCEIVAESVPFWRAPGSRSLGFDEYGSTVREDDSGMTRPDHDVRVRDLFLDEGEAYEVQWLGNRGVHLRVFALRRVRIS